MSLTSQVAAEIFKAYDIRGIVDKSLTPLTVELIGKALGTEARRRGGKTIAIGRDGRLSGPSFAEALARGIQSTGIDVIDIGLVATPMVYFAAYHLNTGSGVMITGSHNPPDYNGIKMVIQGDTLALDAIQVLKRRIDAGDFERAAAGQEGKYSQQDISDAYVARIVGDARLTRKMKVVVDCGNGAAGMIAPRLFKALGCDVIELFCEVDGTFPNHHPDPAQPKNLQDVIRTLKETDAELGLAFDGDGDRLGVVTKDGEIIFPDRQLMLFAADVLSRVPGGEVLFDVKSTRHLFKWVRDHGGKPTMYKTGHSLLKNKMKEVGAPIAGEMSGHIFFKERWYGFDDALYCGARLLEIVSAYADAGAPLKALPNAISTPELNWKLAEGEPHRLVEQLQKTAKFEGADEIITIDGVRVEYPDGFGLARASNTTPVITLRFEADTDAGLQRIMADFRRVLSAAKPDVPLPF
ncbi:MAG: phosphomannomutase/phosphoglucomutase [Betaproteobacteria bacterium]|nr:phosphomannomutase/phosphoglucomutase [Betaproteobacteria bacterium]